MCVRTNAWLREGTESAVSLYSDRRAIVCLRINDKLIDYTEDSRRRYIAQ